MRIEGHSQDGSVCQPALHDSQCQRLLKHPGTQCTCSCSLWCTALAIASDKMTEAISGERAVLNPNCILEREVGLVCSVAMRQAFSKTFSMADVTVIPLWLDGSELSLSFFGIEVMAPMHMSFGMCPVELMPRKRL